MNLEENKRFFRRRFERFPADVDETFAPDCVFHDLPNEIHGLDEFKRVYGHYFHDEADYRVKILDEPVAEGDRVVGRFETSFNHSTELMGYPPTGTRLHIPGFEMIRLRDGKIVERWEIADIAGLQQQLEANASA